MKKNIIHQMTISGLLTGLAILVGVFLHFPIVGRVYLIGIVLFSMPLFLRLDFLIFSTIISVVATDIITGYGSHTWISVIVYGAAAIILWFSKIPKFKLFYIVGLLISGGIVILGYYIFESQIYGRAWAIKELAGTAIEMAIVVPVVGILYFPLRVLGKAFN